MNLRLKMLVVLLLSVQMIMAQRPGGGGGMGQGEPEGIVHGFVHEKNSGKPIEFANIVIYSLRDSSIVSGGITAQDGAFNIDKVRYGRFFIEIQFIGFGKQTIPEITIRPDNKVVNLGKIELALDAEMLEEVEVAATIDRVEYKLDRKVVNVGQDIMSSGATAVEALENVPGVQTDIDGNVSLRGTESFLVLIDGRASPIQGSEALQQIPAESIESIEIITNPSAKYDPDGVGGIINVVMKKDRRAGYNAQISANYGSFNSFGGDFLVNIRKEKLNFFVGGNYNERINRGLGNDQRISFLPGDTSFYLVTTNDRQRIRNSASMRVGADYYIRDNEVVTISARYNSNTYGNNLNSTAAAFYTDANGQEYGDYYYLTNTLFRTNWSYFTGDLNYMKKFNKPGHEIQIYGSYSTNFSDEMNLFSEQMVDSELNPFTEIADSTRTLEDGGGNTLTAKADYTYPFNEKSKIEAGYQVRVSQMDREYKYQTLLVSDWMDDPALTNIYDFYRNVQSGYVIFSHLGDKFGFMTGLRTEYTDRVFEPQTMDTVWQYNKFDFFPTMHVSYKLPADIQLMASYSRRLDRPRPWFLDPFREVVDPNNVRQGNPLLMPEYTNSMELNVQKRFGQHFVSFETYYRETNNKVERYIKVDPQNPEIFISTFENLGKSIAGGGEIMANLNLAKWWNFNLSGSVYYYEIVDVNNTISWNTRLNNTFRLTKYGTSVQLSGFYNGPSITAQGRREAMWMANAAVRQDFFDRKLSVSFNVRDIFGTMGWEMISETPQFYSHITRSRKSPSFAISLTYRINDFQSRRERGLENGFDRDDGEM
jgi:outer membrane cobalamin receptor